MEFKIFREACKFTRFAYDTDDHTRLNIVCQRKIPAGESWGKCDESHCPYYGIQIRNIKVFQNEKLIGTAENGKVVY